MLILLENACIRPKPFVFKQKRPDLVSLRGRTAAVAILTVKVWNPVAKHGSGKQDGSPITKNIRFAASFRFLFLHYFMVPFHSVQPYFVTGWQIALLKIAASGARALLAMTNLVGFAEKRNSFRNETFENGTVFGTKRFQ